MSKRNVYVNLFRGDEVILVNRVCKYSRYSIKQLDVYDCYYRPSKAKVSIYTNWVHWLDGYTVYADYGIQSYNGFHFTFGAYVALPVYDTGNKRIYRLYVTHTRSELIPTKSFVGDCDEHEIDYNEFKYLEKLYW